ncbi:MAG TPA: hypothetical protein VI670_15950 [Thermoanaerobaculia bacterium]
MAKLVWHIFNSEAILDTQACISSVCILAIQSFLSELVAITAVGIEREPGTRTLAA